MSASKILRCFALAFTIALASASVAASAPSVVVGWDANPSNENVTGYTLHWGTVSRDAPGFTGFDHQADVGNVTEWSLELPDGTTRCYFSVSAYNADGLVSDYSEELGTVVVTPAATAGGAISPAEATVVELGGSVTFELTPDPDYEVEDVEIDGVSVGATSSYALTNITAPREVLARFALAGQPGVQQFSVSLSSGGHGTVLPNGTVVVEEGDSLTFTVTPDTGYRTASVYVNGTDVGPVSAYTISSISSDVVVTAAFQATETSPTDTDGDQIPDAWELQYFSDLNVDPSGDADADGRSNYAEYVAGTDPTAAELDAALTPALAYPVSGAIVVFPRPELAVDNPINGDGLTLTYQFQVGPSPDMASPTAEIEGVAAGTLGVTTWRPAVSLSNQTQYYWRARAVGDAVTSEWTPIGTFYIDTAGVATTSELIAAQYVESASDSSLEILDPSSGVDGLGVEVPATTLPYDFILTVSTVSNPPPAGSTTRLAGKTVEFGPNGRPFEQDVTILLPYTDQMLAEANVASAGDLTVLTYNTETLQWENVPGVVTDYVGQRMIARVEHFSMYSVGAATAQTPVAPASSGGGGGGGGCFLNSLW